LGCNNKNENGITKTKGYNQLITPKSLFVTTHAINNTDNNNKHMFYLDYNCTSHTMETYCSKEKLVAVVLKAII
jgi:hypothetical protein